MFEVLECRYDDLTPEQRDKVPDNGYGKEEANYLKIVHNYKTVGIYSDAMEPEDTRFTRDLIWIQGVVEWAYELGFKDGKMEEQ